MLMVSLGVFAGGREAKIFKSNRIGSFSSSHIRGAWSALGFGLGWTCTTLTFTTSQGGKANKTAEKVDVEPREVQLWQYYCPSLESHKPRNVPPFWLPPGGQLLGATSNSLLGGCHLDMYAPRLGLQLTTSSLLQGILEV